MWNSVRFSKAQRPTVYSLDQYNIGNQSVHLKVGLNDMQLTARVDKTPPKLQLTTVHKTPAKMQLTTAGCIPHRYP